MSTPAVDPDLKTVYDQLCTSYHAIDDFRAKLLGLLPLATTAGILLIFDKIPNAASLTDANQLPPLIKAGLGSAAFFGMLITLGLFVYEIYGIRKCDALIVTGQHMERRLGVPGQFATRPRAVRGLLNEPFAAAVIYPAVMAAWTYVALSFILAPSLAVTVAFEIFIAGFVGTAAYGLWLGEQHKAHDAKITHWQETYPWLEKPQAVPPTASAPEAPAQQPAPATAPPT
jgi:hypothetical protein